MKQQILYSFILLIFLNSCSVFTSPKLEELNGKDVIVFVPGYKGSRLVNTSGETVWLSMGQLLFGDESMAYGSEDNLKPDGVLKEIEVIPYLYSIDIYQECFDKLNAIENSEVVEFGYDWRDSNVSTASKFRELIKKIEKVKPKSISVIAHSMGGLSVAYALGYSEPLKIDKIIFLGTLFRGTLKAFLDMNRENESLPIDKDFFTREDYITFKSAYEFLPHPDDVSFSDTNLKNKDTIYNIENWKQYSWGTLMQSKDPKIELSLKQNLEHGKSFFDSFEYISVTCPNSSILNIQGSESKVQDRYSLDSSKKGEFQNDEKVSFEDGDGLVTVKSSNLPSSLRKCSHKDLHVPKAPHDKMCQNKKVMKEIKSFLMMK